MHSRHILKLDNDVMSYMFTHVVEDLKVREIQYDRYAFFRLLTVLMKSPYFLGFVYICVSVACITCAPVHRHEDRRGGLLYHSPCCSSETRSSIESMRDW